MPLKEIDLSESAAGEEDPGAGIELTRKPASGGAAPPMAQHDDEPVVPPERPAPGAGKGQDR